MKLEIVRLDGGVEERAECYLSLEQERQLLQHLESIGIRLRFTRIVSTEEFWRHVGDAHNAENQLYGYTLGDDLLS